jgi:hypothetical protein
MTTRKDQGVDVGLPYYVEIENRKKCDTYSYG